MHAIIPAKRCLCMKLFEKYLPFTSRLSSVTTLQERIAKPFHADDHAWIQAEG
jgi:hypothetical protein